MDPPVAVIGDIHGDISRLEAMLARLIPLGRRLVFVGDYVNRGADSAKVLASLVDLRATHGHGVVLLAGNHERALLDYLSVGDIVSFARYGGLATIRSYVGTARGDVSRQFRMAFPDGHERLLTQGLASYYQDAEIFVSHTGYDPRNPLDWSRQTISETSHPDLFQIPVSLGPRALAVCGHYVQPNGVPFDRDGLICLDTGCGTIGGPLTAVLLPEREYIRV